MLGWYTTNGGLEDVFARNLYPTLELKAWGQVSGSHHYNDGSQLKF